MSLPAHLKCITLFGCLRTLIDPLYAPWSCLPPKSDVEDKELKRKTNQVPSNGFSSGGFLSLLRGSATSPSAPRTKKTNAGWNTYSIVQLYTDVVYITSKWSSNLSALPASQSYPNLFSWITRTGGRLLIHMRFTVVRWNGNICENTMKTYTNAHKVFVDEPKCRLIDLFLAYLAVICDLLLNRRR